MSRGQLLPLRRVAGDVATLSDDALLAACGVGDSAALGALYDRHHQTVFRFLAHMRSTDARDLEDLVQTTFLEAQRSAHRFRGDSAARTWLLGIAANVVRHHARGEARRRSFLGRLVDLPLTDVVRPDQNAERGELWRRLAAALETLPHDQRAAFVLCDVEDLPGADAARVLGVREASLWRCLYAARKRLQILMGAP